MNQQTNMMYILLMIKLIIGVGSCYAGWFEGGYGDRRDLVRERALVCSVPLPDGPITDEVAKDLYDQHRAFHDRPNSELEGELKKIIDLPDGDKHTSLSAVIALIRAGVSPNVQDYRGRTIFHFVVGHNYLHVAEYLLRKEAPMRLSTDSISSPIFCVNTLQMLELLKKYKTDFTPRDSYRSMRSHILHHLIKRKVSIGPLLPDLDFLVNEADLVGNTPLMEAASMPTTFGYKTEHGIPNNNNVRILLHHGAKRFRRVRHDGSYRRSTVAQLIAEKNEAASLELVTILNSARASTLAEMALRTLLIHTTNVDEAIAEPARADVRLLQLPETMPAAYAAVLERLTARKNDGTASELVRRQVKRDIRYLEMLRRSCSMTQQLIEEFAEEQRKPGTSPASSSSSS